MLRSDLYLTIDRFISRQKRFNFRRNPQKHARLHVYAVLSFIGLLADPLQRIG